MYSDLFLKPQTPRSIPKVFVIGVIALFGLIASQVFVWYGSVPSRASDVRLARHTPVNVGDTEAAIFFETNEPVGAYVLFGESSTALTRTAYKTDETPNNTKPAKLHFITLSGLRADTTYFYRLISDGKILTESGEDSFTLTTQSQRNLTLSGRRPIYGKVVTPEGNGLAQAYILVELPGRAETTFFLAQSKESGEWLMPLPSNLQTTDPIYLEVMHEDYPSSHVKTVFEKAAPLPQSIVIGTDYSFNPLSENVLPASTRRTDESAYAISLLYPAKDAVIPNTRPLFKGYGIPRTSVTVKVNSKPPFEATSIINSQGVWVVEAARPFTPGGYIVAVTVSDNLGQTRTITRFFTIAKNGEQVLGEASVATPSGTLSPTLPLTPSQGPTQPVVVTATPAPTGVIYITATPFPGVTITVTPPELEKSGGEIPLAWLIFGSLFISAGVFLIRFYPDSVER